MAITKENLRALYQQHDKVLQEEQKTKWEARKLEEKKFSDVFLNQERIFREGKKPRPVTLNIRRLGMSVQALVAAYASMGVELEVGDKPSSRRKSSLNEHALTLSPQDLKKIADHIAKKQKRFGGSMVHGMPYGSLVRASREGDKARAKLVRTVTPYGNKKNLWSFLVSGNDKPHYLVRIRFEEWDSFFMDAERIRLPPMLAAKQMVEGRLSIDCQCGRHQFWYRYLASIGQYAVEPLEKAFPKIRNPTLTGCCCKHVLKTLQVMKTNRFLLLLTRVIDKLRKKRGFAGSNRAQIFTEDLLSLAQSERLGKRFMKQFRDFEAHAEKHLKPKRSGKKPPTPVIDQKKSKLPQLSDAQLEGVRTMLKNIEMFDLPRETTLEQVAKKLNITRTELDAVIKEHKL